MGGEQFDQELLVLGAKLRDESGQSAGPVIAGLKQARHPACGERRLKATEIDGKAVHVGAPGRFAVQRTFGVQSGQGGHNRGVGESAAQLSKHLGRGQWPFGSPENGEDLCFQRACVAPSRSGHGSILLFIE
jgi:hypothetical protein